MRLHTTLRDVTIESFEIVGAYDDEAPLVWPVPKNIEYLGGYTRDEEKNRPVYFCNVINTTTNYCLDTVYQLTKEELDAKHAAEAAAESAAE